MHVGSSYDAEKFPRKFWSERVIKKILGAENGSCVDVHMELSSSSNLIGKYSENIPEKFLCGHSRPPRKIVLHTLYIAPGAPPLQRALLGGSCGALQGMAIGGPVGLRTASESPLAVA